MKIKTSELIGPALDWAVECALGTFWSPNGYFCFDKKPGWNNGYPFQSKSEWSYSSDWSQGGPIIERERIRVAPNLGGSSWHGQIRHEKDDPRFSYRVLAGWTNQHGPTLLIAAMRCFVASVKGEYVDVPEELLS